MHIKKKKILLKHSAANDMTFSYVFIDRLTGVSSVAFGFAGKCEVPAYRRYKSPKGSSSF